MEVRNSVESFLDQQTSEGREAGQGAFTLERGKALEKLSQFQLQGSGEWTLKILQALVVAQCPEVSIKLTAHDVQFRFQVPQTWTAGRVEAAFLSVEEPSDLSLLPLIIGLRTAGIRHQRRFVLKLESGQECVTWDGTEFLKTRCHKSEATLVVDHLSSKERSTLSWLAKKRIVGRRNLECSSFLKKQGFLCPVPLLLDGKRIEGLQLCPHHGWTDRIANAGIHFLSPDLPALTLSHRNFENPDRRQKALAKKEKWLTRKAARALEGPAESPLVLSLSFKITKLSRVSFKAGSISLNWVKDGVVVHGESFPNERGALSLGLYLSATGLDSDLTTLSLLECEEKSRRAQVAIASLDDFFKIPDLEERLDYFFDHNKVHFLDKKWNKFKNQGGWGGTTILLSMMTPFVGGLGLGAGLLTVGGAIIVASGELSPENEMRRRRKYDEITKLEEQLHHLKESVQALAERLRKLRI